MDRKSRYSTRHRVVAFAEAHRSGIAVCRGRRARAVLWKPRARPGGYAGVDRAVGRRDTTSMHGSVRRSPLSNGFRPARSLGPTQPARRRRRKRAAFPTDRDWRCTTATRRLTGLREPGATRVGQMRGRSRLPTDPGAPEKAPRKWIRRLATHPAAFARPSDEDTTEGPPATRSPVPLRIW